MDSKTQREMTEAIRLMQIAIQSAISALDNVNMTYGEAHGLRETLSGALTASVGYGQITEGVLP